MSLSAALNIAQSALANNAAQSSLLSTNIANVSNANYSRRSVQTITQSSGTVSTGATQRATDSALLTNLLSAQSSATSASSLSDGLTQIASTLDLDSTTSTSTTTSTDTSPATLITALSTALQAYAASPDDSSLATAAVSAAKALATNLNTASTAVQAVRTQADKDIATSVSTINSLLAQFKTANDAVVAGTRAGTDVSDAEDTRDGILKSLSSEIGITTTTGSSGSISIYTDSGVTLFETSPRTVTFTASSSLSAGTSGNAVMVDGVAVTGSSSVMPIQSGRLAGLTTLRDTTATNYQNQLDQIASGLISAFSESDQTSSGKATLAGLFTDSGSTTIPTTTTGLAASISIAASVDPTAGGTATKLRDGNISSSDSAYTYNTDSDSAYSDRLTALNSSLTATRSFDSTSGGAAVASLSTYATSSVSWVEAQRTTATSSVTYTSALVGTTTTALSNSTGVNLDDQMSMMLDIEHAYQASAELMNTVKSMYASLLAAFS